MIWVTVCLQKKRWRLPLSACKDFKKTPMSPKSQTLDAVKYRGED